MITVDTSALIAVLLKEPTAAACTDALDRETEIKLSAGTYLESLIVAAGRGFAEAMIELVDGLEAEVVPVTAASARRAAEAYRRWGRGFHPAALNFGDLLRLRGRGGAWRPPAVRRRGLREDRSGERPAIAAP